MKHHLIFRWIPIYLIVAGILGLLQNGLMLLRKQVPNNVSLLSLKRFSNQTLVLYHFNSLNWWSKLETRAKLMQYSILILCAFIHFSYTKHMIFLQIHTIISTMPIFKLPPNSGSIQFSVQGIRAVSGDCLVHLVHSGHNMGLHCFQKCKFKSNNNNGVQISRTYTTSKGLSIFSITIQTMSHNEE